MGQSNYYFVNNWKNTTQAVESRFASSLKNKLGRTMPNICHLVLRLERTIRNTFIPDVTGGHIFYDKEKLISLPNRHGGLFILVFPETAEINYELQQDHVRTYNIK